MLCRECGHTALVDPRNLIGKLGARAIVIGGDNGERTEAIWPRGQEAKEDGVKEAERRQCWVGL
jgi:hypothetical protein